MRTFQAPRLLSRVADTSLPNHLSGRGAVSFRGDVAVKPVRSALALALTLCIGAGAHSAASAQAADAASADRFVAAINQEIRDNYVEVTAAQWVAETYINGDTEVLVAKANERALGRLSVNVEKSKEFIGVKGIAPATQRGIDLVKMQTAMPAPKDPAKLSELTQIASRLNAAYGAGKSCTDEARPETCRNLDQLSKVLAENRDWDAGLDAWTAWHDIARGMRKDYMRFAELVNEGAGEMGYANAGEMWRAGYDMSAADLRKETDRLWGQVEPLYKDLQCYARHKLAQQYPGKLAKDGTIPAHITGNMWAQDWSALYPLLQPYPGVSNLDVDAALKEKAYTPEAMVKRAEDFYSSIGFPALPKSFYEKSQLTRPADRDVVCHASAWDMNFVGDVRIKMCINAERRRADARSITSSATSITTLPITTCRHCSRPVPTMASTRPSATPWCSVADAEISRTASAWSVRTVVEQRSR